MIALQNTTRGHFATAGIDALLQHVGLLLAVLQQTELDFTALNPVEAAAGLLVVVASSERGMQQLCSSMQYAHQLLGVLKNSNERAALTAGHVLNRMAVRPERARLLTQQCCIDRLVAVLGVCDQQIARYVIVRLGSLLEVLLPKAGLPAAGTAAATAAAAGQVPACPAAAAAAATGTAPAAAMSNAGKLVLQHWHVQQLIEAAQSPQLTEQVTSLLNRICDAGDEYALLLGSFQGALRKAADLFGQLAGVEWVAAHPNEEHVFEQLQPLIANRENVVSLVHLICTRAQVAAKQHYVTNMRQVLKARRELWEAKVCFAEAYARYNACNQAARSAGARQASVHARMVQKVQQQQQQQQQLDAALESLVASSGAHDALWTSLDEIERVCYAQ
jgi:hypothetical protein